MYCEKITYTNYRNLKTLDFEPCRGVNMLMGRNAQGKTNLLEGIYYFAQGHGLKGSFDRELIKFGEQDATLKLVFADNTRVRNHEIEFFSNKKKVCKKEGVAVSSIREFIGVFRVVCFTPNHLAIIKESPSLRRNFLDSAISQIYPAYMLSLVRYNKILAQRNALLKDFEQQSFEEIIRALSLQLAKEAEFISAHRARYCERLQRQVAEILRKMTDGVEEFSLVYKEPIGYERYCELLTSNLEKEKRQGSSLYGTHKDDVVITLNGVDARSFASQGQQRSIAFALKLAEGEIVKEVSGEYPVFLFDDVLSELDSQRKSFILNELKGKQVIITGCEKVVGEAKVFLVNDGEIFESREGEAPCI